LRDVENAQLGYTSTQTEYESTGNNIKSRKKIYRVRKTSLRTEKPVYNQKKMTLKLLQIV